MVWCLRMMLKCMVFKLYVKDKRHDRGLRMMLKCMVYYLKIKENLPCKKVYFTTVCLLPFILSSIKVILRKYV